MLLSTSFTNVNLLAALVAGIVNMVIGLIWFLPKFFGKAWRNLPGRK